MRRVPYIKIDNRDVHYICPRCKHEIQRDLYILNDYCPTCEHPINKISKSMIETYSLVDKEMLKHFIDKY